MFLLPFIILNIFHREFSFTLRIGKQPANGIFLPEVIAVKTCTLIRSGSNGLHMKASNKVPEEAPLSGGRKKSMIAFLWTVDAGFHWPILRYRHFLLWSFNNHSCFWKTIMVLLETNSLRFGIRSIYTREAYLHKRQHT